MNAYSIKCGTSGSAPARPISLSCVITLLFIYPFVVVCKIHPAIAAAQIVFSCAAGTNTSLRNTSVIFCFCGRVICVKQFISILIQTHNRNTYVMFTHQRRFSTRLSARLRFLWCTSGKFHGLGIKACATSR